jgi:hypothetical protein
MLFGKDVGQPYAGKPHVRLDEGEKGSVARSGRSLPQSRKADTPEAPDLNDVRLLSTLLVCLSRKNRIREKHESCFSQRKLKILNSEVGI